MSTENRFKWSLALSTLLFFILLLTAVKTGFAQSSNDAYQIENFSVSGEVYLEVQTSGGSINVIGSNEGEVKVEMYVKRRGEFIEPGQANLKEYTIDITQSGDKVTAIAKKNSGFGWNWNKDHYSISFIVYTPNSTNSRLKTSGGSLSAKSLTGSLEMRTSGGSISAEGINGEMVLKTSGGSINIADVQGAVNARTSGGSISAKSIVGNLDVKTSGGSINLDNLEGNVSAKTSGGYVSAKILAPMDFVELSTSGGSIDIAVPRENGYNLDLDAQRVYTELINFNGKTERDEIYGTMNGGGTRIKAKTSGGSINLHYL